MDTIRSLLSIKPTPQPKAAAVTADATDSAAAAADAYDATQTLQSQFQAQTIRLRDGQKATRPKNTTKQYEPKQKEWEEWCAKLPGNTDGAWVTEDKLCLFLEQEVVNRESRAPGYRERKAKRKEAWKDTERAKKKARTGKEAVKKEKAAAEEEEELEEEEEEEWDEEALDAQFSETVQFAVVNAYVSAITDLYGWQFEAKASPPPLRGAKLSALLDSVRRDQDRVRRVNFTDRGLFTIASGYDVKGLKRAIIWCWEAACSTPGSAESYLRTVADCLLGPYCLLLPSICLLLTTHLAVCLLTSFL